MSIQWTIIATFLYTEIGAVIFLLLPFISATKWQKLFKSKILNSLGKQSHIYFNVFILILVLFFLDAIRDVRKYSIDLEDHKLDTHSHVEAEMQIHMKLFRAQRNFYISGFALFLLLVIRRIVTLISAQATLKANNEAAMKQAQSATETATQLLNEKEKSKEADGENADNVGNIEREKHEAEVKNLKNILTKAEEELSHSKIDLDSMKKQSESVTKEYDRLLKEHETVQVELEKLKGSKGAKKDEWIIYE